MPDSPRIEELKRRVSSDPASIAFAALAEEYRRAERYEEAIETCRAGLVRHPSYLSAHVTLGRAFIEVGRLKEAREELEFVLKLAPENLAAIRGLAEIHHRLGEEGSDAHVDLSLSGRRPAPVEAAAVEAPPSVDPPQQPPDALIRPAAAVPPTEEPMIPPVPVMSDVVLSAGDASVGSRLHVTYPAPVDPALSGLEEFLNAIIRARAERAGAR